MNGALASHFLLFGFGGCCGCGHEKFPFARGEYRATFGRARKNVSKAWK
jgi:hypothetical protein